MDSQRQSEAALRRFSDGSLGTRRGVSSRVVACGRFLHGGLRSRCRRLGRLATRRNGQQGGGSNAEEKLSLGFHDLLQNHLEELGAGPRVVPTTVTNRGGWAWFDKSRLFFAQMPRNAIPKQPTFSPDRAKGDKITIDDTIIGTNRTFQGLFEPP